MRTYIKKFNSVKELIDYYTNRNQFLFKSKIDLMGNPKFERSVHCHIHKTYKLNWRKRLMNKLSFRHIVFSILIFSIALFIFDMSKSYKAEKSRNALYKQTEILYNQGMINKSQLLYTYVYK